MWDALTTPVPLLLTLIGARIAPISYEKTSNMSGKGNMVISALLRSAMRKPQTCLEKEI